MGFPLTSEFMATDQQYLLQKLYRLSETPVRSKIREWLVRCGFNYTKCKKGTLLKCLSHQQIKNIKKNRQHDTYEEKGRRTTGIRSPLGEANALITEGFLVAGKGYN
jgi:hypothetical protein